MDTATQVHDEITASTGTTQDPSLGATSSPDPVTEADLLVEELRIDDLSIDGMCGVY